MIPRKRFPFISSLSSTNGKNEKTKNEKRKSKHEVLGSVWLKSIFGVLRFIFAEPEEDIFCLKEKKIFQSKLSPKENIFSVGSFGGIGWWIVRDQESQSK